MLLEVEGLAKEYFREKQRFEAICDVEMSIDKGELVGVFGPSGSGKSTLLNILAGLLQPTVGTVKYLQMDIIGQSNKVLSKYRNAEIGYIMQGQSVLNNFTVLENVCLPYYLSNKTGDCMEYARELVKMVGLEGYENVYTNRLSGGEARRVAVARALINSPKLIIADEPTSNLDPINSAKIFELFKAISNNGTAVLVSTHDVEFKKYSDRIYNMNYGKVNQN